jgi:hypothetical protein
MAVSIVSRRIEAGDRRAPKRIVELFVRTGRADDAVGFLSQDGHDDVDRDAVEQVVGLLLKLGRIDDAVAVLGRRAAGGAAAANRLADLLADDGRVADLRSLVGKYGNHALKRLMLLLADLRIGTLRGRDQELARSTFSLCEPDRSSRGEAAN